MHILIAFALSIIAGLLSNTRLDEHFHNDGEDRYRSVPAYPDKYPWEDWLLIILSWAAGLLQGVLSLALLIQCHNWISLLMVSGLCVFIAFVIAVLSPIPFILIDALVRCLIERRRRCIPG